MYARSDETRRRDGETTTATKVIHDAQANDDQNGIGQTTVRIGIGPHRGFRLKQRGDGTKLCVTVTAMASTARTAVRICVSGFRNHRPQRVALFNICTWRRNQITGS